MRTTYALRSTASRPAPRGLQKVLTEDQIQLIVQRETSRADRTGQQFSVVLFSVKAGVRRWSLSTCRIARVLLSRVRQTDDVGWFDDRHLCAILPDTPAAGARIFAARTCEEIARRQPRPTSLVYGYPGTSPDCETVDIAGIQEIPLHGHVNGKSHEKRTAHARHGGGGGGSGGNGRARHNGNGNGNGNGHGHGARSENRNGNGSTHGALALAEAPPENGHGLAVAEREQLVEYFLDGVSAVMKQPAAALPGTEPATKPDGALEDFFVVPMPRWKRCLDLFGATFGLLMLSPVLLFAAAAIKLTSKGPVIFKQRRSGLGGKPFTIYKFRTMCVDAERKQDALRKINEQDGPAFKLKHDPRVTRIGKLLRKTSIDELPQLFNVVKGDMSLVGPRPLPVKEQGGCEQWQRHRLNVTPGLTCIWQVAGRSEVTFDEWVRMDVAYMRRQSLWHDLSILARTIPAVLLRRGAK